MTEGSLKEGFLRAREAGLRLRWKLLSRQVGALSTDARSFDCVTAPLRGAVTSLRMTKQKKHASLRMTGLLRVTAFFFFFFFFFFLWAGLFFGISCRRIYSKPESRNCKFQIN